LGDEDAGSGSVMIRASEEAPLGSTKTCGGVVTLGARSFAVLVLCSGVSFFEVDAFEVLFDRVFMLCMAVSAFPM
jgi:hypothetical protein